jgi:hypothetical protein
MKKMSDDIKFTDNSREVVTLTYDEPLENTNTFGKKQYIYGVEETITGCTKFSATEKLHEKIQLLGAEKGTTLYITKTKDPEINNGYAFFKVEGSEDNPEPKKKSKPLHKSIQKFEEQFKPKETELDTHELSLRVEKLEKIVAALWKDKGDDDIPF